MTMPPSRSITLLGINYQTEPFAILEPQAQETDEFYVAQIRRTTDFDTPEFWKGRTGDVYRIWGT